MTWEQKTEMCQLFNTDQIEPALDLVIANLETMDDQAWSMFFHALDLRQVQLQAHREKHLQIVEKTKHLQSGSITTAIRMAMYEELLSAAAE